MVRIPTDTKELKNETLSWREKEIINQYCKLSQDSTDASVLKILRASSATSRRAAVAKSSSGSTPPLGTTHLSGTFELETSNTYKTVILEDLYLQQVLIFMKILEEVGDIYREVQQFKPHSLCKVYNVHTSIMWPLPRRRGVWIFKGEAELSQGRSTPSSHHPSKCRIFNFYLLN